MPSVPFILGLLRSKEARAAVREADVIDLQYSESIRLVRLLRRLNPTGPDHRHLPRRDEPVVLPRAAGHSEAERRYWQGVAERSRGHEKAMVARLDEVLVFSDKDAELLGSPAAHRRAPAAVRRRDEPRHTCPATGRSCSSCPTSPATRTTRPRSGRSSTSGHWCSSSDPTPGCGSSAAARATQLRERVGLARGGQRGRPHRLRRRPRRGVRRIAAAALVPVLQGAGVKFKTVEALCHGVPVVTTTVGRRGHRR